MGHVIRRHDSPPLFQKLGDGFKKNTKMILFDLKPVIEKHIHVM